MKPFVTSSDIAVGYTPPKFPGLTLHFESNDATSEFLYYSSDIWKFTLFWTLIVFAVFYLAAGVIAAVGQRKLFNGIFIILVYFVWGIGQAFISGSIVGILLATLYRSGSFMMNTWIPLIWAGAQILYVIVLSYSMTSVIL